MEKWLSRKLATVLAVLVVLVLDGAGIVDLADVRADLVRTVVAYVAAQGAVDVATVVRGDRR